MVQLRRVLLVVLSAPVKLFQTYYLRAKPVIEIARIYLLRKLQCVFPMLSY